MSDTASYKTLHENFVSDFNGTSLLEISLVVSAAPLAVLLRNVAVAWLCVKHVDFSAISRYVQDFWLLIVPVLLSFTLLGDHCQALVTSLALCVAGLIYMAHQIALEKHTNSSLTQIWPIIANTAVSGRRPFITNYRAFVNIAAATSILAVDFQIFPRRFCKAETFGTGLMDIGVGAFVVSNAIVSPEARGKTLGSRSWAAHGRGLMKTFWGCMPLLILGFLRTISVKAADYQEHVSEYGVHWNFFFTLAFVKLSSWLVFVVFPVHVSWLLALVLASGYQYLLDAQGLQHYVLWGVDGRGGRYGWLDANREGLCSCLGYLAVYLAGVALGSYLMRARVKLKEWLTVLFVLMLTASTFYGLLYYAQTHGHLVSRRLANFSFVLWMVAYNTQVLTCFLCVDLATLLLTELGLLEARAIGRMRSGEDRCLLAAINHNGLFFFLLANLFTGLVNLTIHTLYATTAVATFIMLGYLAVLMAVVAVLHQRNITLKCW